MWPAVENSPPTAPSPSTPKKSGTSPPPIFNRNHPRPVFTSRGCPLNSNLSRGHKTAQPNLGPRIYEGAAERSEAGGADDARSFTPPAPSGHPPRKRVGQGCGDSLKQLDKPEFEMDCSLWVEKTALYIVQFVHLRFLCQKATVQHCQISQKIEIGTLQL